MTVHKFKPIRESIEVDDKFRQAVYIINTSIMDNCHGEEQAMQSNVIKKWKEFLISIDYDIQIV